MGNEAIAEQHCVSERTSSSSRVSFVKNMLSYELSRTSLIVLACLQGSDGVIHTWDMRNRKCISRFVDEGALHGTSLACSPGQQYLAAGSDVGFVNIYNQQGTIQVGKSAP